MSEPRTATWGDFEIHFDDELGRGGMGVVYRARQISLDRDVAVKVLDPRGDIDDETRQAILHQFQAESRALARLNDPSIVQVIQAGETEGRFWFAMELVEGRTVDQLISERGALPELEVARVGAAVARALDSAARQGIVHRDIKPGNIFVLPDGRVKVADWGLSKSMGAAPGRMTQLNQMACTPAYASPEQAAGRLCDSRSDMYSLGVVLYEMLCECPPFHSESPLETLFQHTTQEPPSLRRLNPEITTEMEEVVLRCLRKDPAQRFASPMKLTEALEKIGRGAEVEIPAGRGPRRALIASFVLGLAGTGLWVSGLLDPLDPDPAQKIQSALLPNMAEPPPEVELVPSVAVEGVSQPAAPVVDDDAPVAEPEVRPLAERLLSHPRTDSEEAVLDEMLSKVRSAYPEMARGEFLRVRRDLEALKDDLRCSDFVRAYLNGALEFVEVASAMSTKQGSPEEVHPRARWAFEGTTRSAAGALAELLQQDRDADTRVLWTPLLAALGLEETLQNVRSNNHEQAAQIASGLLGRRSEILALAPSARRILDGMEREMKALEHYRLENYAEVVGVHPDAAVAAEACRKLHAQFEARLDRDLIGGSEFLEWKLRPEAPDDAERLRRWKRDRVTSTEWIRGEGSFQYLTRGVAPGMMSEGLHIDAVCGSHQADSCWRISFSASDGEWYVRIEGGTLSVHRTRFGAVEGDDLLASSPLSQRDGLGPLRISIIPAPSRLFIFVDGGHLLTLDPAPSFQISALAVGVSGGEVGLRSIRIGSGHGK